MNRNAEKIEFTVVACYGLPQTSPALFGCPETICGAVVEFFWS